MVELAVVLGMTASGLRNVISRHRIQPVGRKRRAKLYNPADVLRHTGMDDRLAKKGRSRDT